METGGSRAIGPRILDDGQETAAGWLRLNRGGAPRREVRYTLRGRCDVVGLSYLSGTWFAVRRATQRWLTSAGGTGTLQAPEHHHKFPGFSQVLSEGGHFRGLTGPAVGLFFIKSPDLLILSTNFFPRA